MQDVVVATISTYIPDVRVLLLEVLVWCDDKIALIELTVVMGGCCLYAAFPRQHRQVLSSGGTLI